MWLIVTKQKELCMLAAGILPTQTLQGINIPDILQGPLPFHGVLLDKLSPQLSAPKLTAPSHNFFLFKMTHGSLIFPSLDQVLSPDLEPRRCKIVPKPQIISSLHLPAIQERDSHTPDKARELTPLILYNFSFIF